MPTKAVIEVIQTGLIIAIKTIPLIPFQIQTINNRYFVTKREINGYAQKLCIILFLISFAITFLELCHVLYNIQPINLVALMYHVFLTLSKAACGISACTYYIKYDEFLFLLNCFCTRPNGLVTSSTRRCLKSNNVLFLILLIAVTSTLLIVYTFILHIGTIMFPCLHNDALMYIFRKIKYTSILFRSIIILVHGPVMVFLGVTGYFNSAVSLVTLNEITNDLRMLR